MSTVRVLTDCFIGTTSGPRRLHGGDELDANDPVVKANPQLFTEPPAPEPKRPTFTSKGKNSGD